MSIIDHNVRSVNRATFFNSFLTLDSSKDATGDYSGGVTEFSYTNTDADNTLFIGNLVINISDDSALSMDEYGSIGTTLSNGLNVYYTGSTGTVRNDIIGTSFSIHKNADFLDYTTDVVLIDNNTGSSSFTVNLNFQKNRSNIILGVTDKIVVELNDDFTSLSGQTFQLNGFTYANANLI